MRYKELIYNGKTYTEKYKINEVLIAKDLNWLIDAEVENMRLEIHTKENEYTLIINAGKWYNGVFQYGVIRDIEWLNGTFKNGVWYNGVWKNGIFEHGLIFNGKFYDGQILAGRVYGGDFFDVEFTSQVLKMKEQEEQTQGEVQTQPQGEVQTQTQEEVQPQGEVQTQTQEEQEAQVQQTIESLNNIDNTNNYLIRENILFEDKKDELKEIISNISPEPYNDAI